eukprot:CAMPEP_0204402766 /NCGR_PEP_ID=MMETSP0470-20130426/5488_1 /ASSEMBLY_ACC=CAM_ASM_000385 /TAXON_ID=2969 /ORGANISM="Oxyrrhis marina" /LENGTH=72 /DNA_ID=CAMNT_0051397861 /DNA_START=95 /DNA_END=313 /DNA_ORIENTATION=+
MAPDFVHDDDVQTSDACYGEPQSGSFDNRRNEVGTHELHDSRPPPPKKSAQGLIQDSTNLSQHTADPSRPIE